jgi:hypothetical protein
VQISLTNDSIPPIRGGKSLVMIKVDGTVNSARVDQDTLAIGWSAQLH